jgi:hypothetical protein
MGLVGPQQVCRANEAHHLTSRGRRSMNGIKQEAIDRADQVLMNLDTLKRNLPKTKSKKRDTEESRLLGMEEDVTYLRSVIARFSVPFQSNR